MKIRGIKLVILVLGLIIIINSIIQTTLIPFFPILGYIPNINLVTIIIIAFLRGRYYGGFFGLITGLIQDILFARALGVNGLIYFLLGFSIGSIQEGLNNDNVVIPMVFSALGTIIYNFLFFTFMFFLARNIQLSIAIRNIFSLEILYNTILSFLLFKMYSKIFVVPSLRFGNR